MKKIVMTIGLFLISFYGFSQEQDTAKESESHNIITHKVEMGETVMLVSKKYKVKPQDIYDLNPEAVHGITYNTILRVPLDKANKVKHAPKEAAFATNETAAGNSAHKRRGV